MFVPNKPEQIDILAEELSRDLLLRYGPMLTGKDLLQALGYKTSDAFRQALSRDLIGVPLFTIAHRRGKFALSKDVAHWLARQRMQPNFTGADQ